MRRVSFAGRCELLQRLAIEDPAASLALLPKTDYEFKRAVFLRQREAFAVAAGTRLMSLDVYGHSVAGWLSNAVSNSEIRLRMRPIPFERFLRSGRYMTQFETSSSGGAHHHTLRMMIEGTLLGVPLNARPGDRPVYGYLSCSDEAGPVQAYGEIVLRLHEHLGARSTFMLGDSLDFSLTQFTEPLFVPQPVLRPNTLAVVPFEPPTLGHPPAPPGQASPRDVLAFPSVADACGPHRYAEAQVFGGIRPDDVREAVFTLGTRPLPATEDLLDRLQVGWTTTEEHAP